MSSGVGAVPPVSPSTAASAARTVTKIPSVDGGLRHAGVAAGADDGLLARFNADGTVDEDTDARWERMNAIVARSPTDVWAAGEGLPSGELIAVGERSTILRIGATVTLIDAGRIGDAHAVWASPGARSGSAPGSTQ